MRILTLLLIATILIGTSACKKDKDKIQGCMDPDAVNYNPDAEVDDGSCTFAAKTLEGKITEDMTLTDWATGVDYRVKGRVEVYANIIVEPGVEIEVEENGGIYMYDNATGRGTFNAVGTLDKPITIRGVMPQKGYWDKIYIASVSGNNQFSYVIMRHGGGIAYTGEKAMMQVGTSGGNTYPCKIQNCLFEESNGYGLYIHEYSADITGYSKNTFRNNNDYPLGIGVLQLKNLDGNASTYELSNAKNMIDVHGRGRAELNGNQLWKDAGVPYYMRETIEVGASSSIADLTITEGAEFIFEVGKGLDVNYSTLNIQGTAAKPVKFNSVTKTPGSWRGIHIGTDNPKNVFNYLEISNGGYQGWHAVSNKSNIQVGDPYSPNSSLTINNSKIMNSEDCGIYVRTTSTLTETGNTYSNNPTEKCSN